MKRLLYIKLGSHEIWWIISRIGISILMENIHKNDKAVSTNQCLNCTSIIDVGRKFCNNSCAAIFNNKNRAKFIKVICSYCENVLNQPHHLYHKNAKNHYCSQECRYAGLRTAKILELCCDQCGKDVSRPEYKLKTKHNKNFCSRSCRMRYFNIHHHINKGCSSNVSFPEDFLYKQLSSLFPSIEILRNERKALKCGYEIDIYFPNLKFGIEVNGPIHYMPIFGEDKLENVQFKDSVKYQEMHDLGISFLIIDVSQAISKKKMTQYLEKQLFENIVPLIESKMVAKVGV